MLRIAARVNSGQSRAVHSCQRQVIMMRSHNLPPVSLPSGEEADECLHLRRRHG